MCSHMAYSPHGHNICMLQSDAVIAAVTSQHSHICCHRSWSMFFGQYMLAEMSRCCMVLPAQAQGVHHVCWTCGQAGHGRSIVLAHLRMQLVHIYSYSGFFSGRHLQHIAAIFDGFDDQTSNRLLHEEQKESALWWMPLTQLLSFWSTGLIGNIGTIDWLLHAHEPQNCTLCMLQTVQLPLRPTFKVSCQVLRLAASIMLGPVLHDMIQLAFMFFTGSAGDLKSNR